MTNFDDLKLSVESISGGRNTVLLDDVGMPSIVVPFPKLTYADVMSGGTQDALPAFIVDGVEKSVIYVSKYQNIIVNSRAYSLPYKDPANTINFDNSLAACRKKGAGWHLNTNALFAAISMWCYKNNTIPHGNSNYGQDYTYSHEKGVPTYYVDNKPYRTATGSGPVTWYHNYDSSGIADLVGNVWEWVAGMRLVDGEIQIIPNGNAMKADCNMSATSTEWKAIMPDGTLVAPGTAGTLKLDYVSSKWVVSTTITSSLDSSRSANFSATIAASGVNIPQLLKGLGLFPVSDFTYGNGYLAANNVGERLPFRGGGYSNTSCAGVSALYLNNPRTYSNTTLGFRSAFYE